MLTQRVFVLGKINKKFYSNDEVKSFPQFRRFNFKFLEHILVFMRNLAVSAAKHASGLFYIKEFSHSIFIYHSYYILRTFIFVF